MKARLRIMVCLLALSLCGVARGSSTDPAAVAVDALVVRPVCLVATVLGSVVFVISLPIAATSKSIKPAANALVKRPAQDTFKRPLGDLDAIGTYGDNP